MTSLTPVSAEAVIEACDAYLSNRNESIAYSRKVMVEHVFANQRPWWMPFFFKPRTRAQIEESMAGDMWHDYNMISITGGYWAKRAEDLRSVARASINRIVYLSTEDVRLLRDYLAQPGGEVLRSETGVPKDHG